MGKARAEVILARVEAAVERRAITELRPDQIELLQWIANGKQNSDIALIQAVQPITIQTRVGKILDTLGVCTRSAAVAIGFRRGLLK